MTSKLAWLVGFGWFSLIIMFVFLIGSSILSGVFQVVSIILTVLWTIWLCFKVYHWNGKPWRRVHFRAMRLFSRAAGIETAEAKLQGREYDIVRACKILLSMISDNDKDVNDEIVDGLYYMQGKYFSWLVRQSRKIVFSHLSDENLELVCDQIEQDLKFGPPLVIAKLIEDRYGAHEASRYVLAISEGKAF